MGPSTTRRNYTHKGVGFEILTYPIAEHMRSVYGEGRNTGYCLYIYLHEGNSVFNRETKIAEINERCGKWGDFNRRITYATCDEPKERWQQPSFTYSLGRDYQHIWNIYDPTDDTLIADAMDAIDEMIEEGIVTTQGATT